ncbi:MAG TPA: hypothetical protein VGK56_16920 [Anaerolineales bacterium]
MVKEYQARMSLAGECSIGQRRRWLRRTARTTIVLIRFLHHRAGPVVQRLCLLSVVLLAQGCHSEAPTAGVRFPITHGSHTILPATQQRILLWGDAALADVALEWLLSHHYSSVLMPEKGPFHNMQISHSVSDRKAALAVANEMKADFVVFVDREESKEGALIEPQCGSRFYVSVTVRGLVVETGETVFRGSAHYPQCVDLSGETFRNLTCQAVATAWGFRPSGQLDIPSGLMCTAGQTEPTPIR